MLTDSIFFDDRNPYDHASNIMVGSARICYISGKNGQGAWALPGGTTTTNHTPAVAVAEQINHQYPYSHPLTQKATP